MIAAGFSAGSDGPMWKSVGGSSDGGRRTRLRRSAKSAAARNRNMNRIAERVLPAMNDAELDELIWSSYRNDAQTLTTGAEANLLRFRELVGWLTPEESNRWNEIRATFRKNQSLQGVDQSDRFGQAIAQLAAVGGLPAVGHQVLQLPQIQAQATHHRRRDGRVGALVRRFRRTHALGSFRLGRNCWTGPPWPGTTSRHLAASGPL